MDLTPAQQVEIIEMEINDAKAQIALADSIERLIKNKDFKRVFTENFMKENVSRAAKNLADPSFQDAVSQGSLYQQIAAVGQVDQFLRAMLRIGAMARKSLGDYEESREEILAEEE